MKWWYKCIDFDDSDNVKLRSFDNSDIRIARYSWPLQESSTIGEPLNTNRIFGSMVPYYFDRRTLERSQSSNEYTTAAAFFTDAQPIMKNLLMNTVDNIPKTSTNSNVAPWEREAYVDPDMKTDADNMLKDIHTSWSAASSHYIKLNLTVRKDDGFLSGAGPCRYKAKI